MRIICKSFYTIELTAFLFLSFLFAYLFAQYEDTSLIWKQFTPVKEKLDKITNASVIYYRCFN